MEELLKHLRADVDRWLANDEITEHVAADLEHYLRRVDEAYEAALLWDTGTLVGREQG